VLATGVVYRRFDQRSGQTKDYEIYFCCSLVCGRARVLFIILEFVCV
jgi:hypothetical protein